MEESLETVIVRLEIFERSSDFLGHYASTKVWDTMDGLFKDDSVRDVTPTAAKLDTERAGAFKDHLEFGRSQRHLGGSPQRRVLDSNRFSIGIVYCILSNVAKMACTFSRRQNF